MSEIGNKKRQTSPQYGQRLLPVLDEATSTDPERILAVIPKTRNVLDGFENVTFHQFARAINKCSYWLEEQLSSDFSGQAVAYLGSLDLLYHIITLAGVKTNHPVEVYSYETMKHP